jgi:hypothetical protein
MAANLHVMYSETFKGVGLVGGGVYGGGEFLSSAGIFDYGWTAEDMADESVAIAEAYSEEGKIDNVLNLEDSPVMIFSGGVDWLVHSTL